MALPYLTIPELEKLEQYAANMSSIYITLDCKEANFDTKEHPNDPVHIDGIWLTLSKNKKLTLFKNYKIDGVLMQPNFANANISSDDEGYYLEYSTQYGNFYVRPTDDVYFIPRTIQLDGIIAEGATFTYNYAIAVDSNNKVLSGYRYVFPANTIPNKISKYIAKCTVTLYCRYEVTNAPMNLSIIKLADGSLALVMAAFGKTDLSTATPPSIPLVGGALLID